MTQIVDKAFMEINELAQKLVVTEPSFFSNTIERFDAAIRKNVKRPLANADGQLEIVEVTEYLQNARLLTEKSLQRYVNCYSPLRWLWYLRRLPRFIFQGSVSTTYTYDSMLAASISSLSRNQLHDFSTARGLLECEITPSIVKRVYKFCVGVKYLSQIHVLLRLAGKGANFYFDVDGLPHAELTTEQNDAIKLYDQRTAQASHAFSHIGTIASELSKDSYRSEYAYFTTLFPVAEPKWGPSVLGPLMGRHVEVEVWVNYLPNLVSFEELSKLNSDPRLSGFAWWQPEVVPLLLLLATVMPMLVNLNVSLLSLEQFGYLVVKRESFLGQINMYLPFARNIVKHIMPEVALPNSAEELLAALTICNASLWPVRPRNPIIDTSIGVYIDLASATNYLYRILEYPRETGHIANARSQHFELFTQEKIDTSPWQAPKPIRMLRGVKLIHNGKAITDIDAIGANSGTLLIVSCKSLLKGLVYDTGAYREVRNIATTIGQGVDYWKTIKEFLEANPVGDNYNFSAYNKIIAVVCTNDVFYTPTGSATGFIAPGLRAVTTPHELLSWLNNT